MYFFVVFWFKNQEDENNIYTLYKKSHAYGIWKFSSVHHRGISQIFFFILLTIVSLVPTLILMVQSPWILGINLEIKTSSPQFLINVQLSNI